MRADQDLERVVVLYRQSDTMSLWGIPYAMRPGQSSRDLARSDAREPVRPGHYGTPPSNYMAAWIWLGSPGWYGTMDPECIAKVKAFCEKHKDSIPQSPEEWSTLWQ